MAAPVILKKYGNRRLYDARRSGYVTLSEVEELLQEGEDVQVIDAKSGEDLTKHVLVQIILEREETREALPTDFLKQVIRVGASPLKENFSRQLGGFVHTFLDAQRGLVDAQRSFGAEIGKYASAYPQMLMNPFAAFAPQPARPEAPPAQPAPTPPPPQTSRDDIELSRLRDELSETQSLVRALLEREKAADDDEVAPKKKARAPRKASAQKRGKTPRSSKARAKKKKSGGATRAGRSPVKENPMAETKTAKTAAPQTAVPGNVPDLSTPFAQNLQFWQGEMERFLGESERNFEKTLQTSRKLMDEQAKLAEAQMTAMQKTMRMYSDGMSRLVKAAQA
jgi:polyhydroxyalkanoate synthesis repressor PhaR